MICKYQELTRLEMEQVDRENTIVLIPWKSSTTWYGYTHCHSYV